MEKCYFCGKLYNEGEIKDFTELDGEKYYFCEKCLNAESGSISYSFETPKITINSEIPKIAAKSEVIETAEQAKNADTTAE